MYDLVLALGIGTALMFGNISQATPSHGKNYLAVRAPRGTWVEVCATRCVTMRSTDYGPSSKIRPPRIADLALNLWLKICNKPAHVGICEGTIEFLPEPPNPTAPPTDVE